MACNQPKRVIAASSNVARPSWGSLSAGPLTAMCEVTRAITRASVRSRPPSGAVGIRRRSHVRIDYLPVVYCDQLTGRGMNLVADVTVQRGARAHRSWIGSQVSLIRLQGSSECNGSASRLSVGRVLLCHRGYMHEHS